MMAMSLLDGLRLAERPGKGILLLPIRAGQPLQVMVQLAAHESLETTRRYLTPSEHDFRRAAESISEEIHVHFLILF